MTDEVDALVDRVHRSDWGRIVSVLIRHVGDFDIAEDAVQEAFAIAAQQWRKDGIPNNPSGWIVQTAKFKAIDHLRHKVRSESLLRSHAASQEANSSLEFEFDPTEIPDERLRLIFTCCHPSIAVDSQVALTLRILGGLETGEIARAFLTSEVTMAQRLVRAKKKIREAGIPYVIPSIADMPSRLDSVMRVIYLIFNEGYSATKGDSLVRSTLVNEAIYLARTIRGLLDREQASEVTGLLALMLLHDSRRDTRSDDNGDIVLLEDQDRSRWRTELIEEALPLVVEALQGGPGMYSLQAAISAIHCQANSAQETDWSQIVRLYDLLLQLNPSPVIALNRAAAVAMSSGPAAGLALIDDITQSGELADYHLLHAARADFLRRLGDLNEAAASYERAIELATNESEMRFLVKRLSEVTSAQVK